MDHKIEDILDNIFSSNYNLSSGDWSAISNTVKIISAKKNTVIRPCNSYEKDLFYLQKGATGSILSKKNKLICIDICLTGEFFGDYQALLTKEKSPLEITAVTDCTYLVIPFASLMSVYEKCSETEMERIGRIAAEDLYILKHSEIIDMKTLSAKERYLKLYSKKPEIVQQVPVKYIAAYLGITSESLSRIRKEVTKGHLLS